MCRCDSGDFPIWTGFGRFWTNRRLKSARPCTRWDKSTIRRAIAPGIWNATVLHEYNYNRGSLISQPLYHAANVPTSEYHQTISYPPAAAYDNCSNNSNVMTWSISLTTAWVLCESSSRCGGVMVSLVRTRCQNVYVMTSPTLVNRLLAGLTWFSVLAFAPWVASAPSRSIRTLLASLKQLRRWGPLCLN